MQKFHFPNDLQIQIPDIHHTRKNITIMTKATHSTSKKRIHDVPCQTRTGGLGISCSWSRSQ
ncbi:hypothetical protein JI435_416390 [Parastagonospora nodorum SN15]|uniref:Uncharacterized protein n=1 Tax=Phaeosphaeria nodorum (strain SN15 / ATCC MYA-4574 / FGSC 10173) TaxID=321614 RepID=A0A7U2FBS7_PHANO|nr:hypothetical protein JI435_416390 [Parastagonospora nodorum SN15]